MTAAAAVTPPAELSDRDLALQFESLGDNCELGLVQRMLGAEPLGLLRFAGAPLPNLLRAMNARFDGMALPDQVRLQPENGEYMVKLAKYDLIYHAHVKIGAVEPAQLHAQQTRTLRFLIDKLIADLEHPEKILVFRQNEPLLATDLIDLRLALSRYGRPTLLWVQVARPGHPPGTVDIIDDTLMAGYVRRLARRDNVPDLDLPSWLAMLRRAWALRVARPTTTAAPAVAVAEPAVPPRVELTFGAGGNAVGHTGRGWSAPEDGFTWAVGAESIITLGPVPDAEDYWLEMDVVPYVVVPALPTQTLTVSVNGTAVHVFDPLSRGPVGCFVPGELIRGRDAVEIALGHPHAARPIDIAGENDDRPLAIAFRSLVLTGIAGT